MTANCRETLARRLALQIATQLPEDEREAMDVLRYARELVQYVSKGRTVPAISLIAQMGRQEDATS